MANTYAEEILTKEQLEKYNNGLLEKDKLEDIITRLNTEISSNGISITSPSGGELIKIILADYRSRYNKLHYDLLPIKELVGQYQREKNDTIDEHFLGTDFDNLDEISKVVEPITKKYREMAVNMEARERDLAQKSNKTMPI